MRDGGWFDDCRDDESGRLVGLCPKWRIKMVASKRDEYRDSTFGHLCDHLRWLNDNSKCPLDGYTRIDDSLGGLVEELFELYSRNWRARKTRLDSVRLGLGWLGLG